MKTYNNNDKQITNMTYSNMSFANSESRIAKTKLNISFFNALLKIGIALQNNANTNNEYATYDNEHQIAVYLSWNKAKILHDMIIKIKDPNSDVKNVCIETKGGLLMVSDGTKYGTTNPCVSILYNHGNGDEEVIYETKSNYKVAYNFENEQQYEESIFDNMELDALQTVLIEYYKASTSAVAASVMHANMYKNNYTNNMIAAIADKVGANTGSSKGGYTSRSFLNKESNNTNNTTTYTQSSFEDIASMM